jgi:LemA protein
VEAYPELKANENMLKLQEEVATTENRIAFARQAYNDSVMFYNTYRQSFPQNLFSSSFGHTQDAALLEFADSAAIQEAPKIKF